jgi:hypothetical protein
MKIRAPYPLSAFLVFAALLVVCGTASLVGRPKLPTTEKQLAGLTPLPTNAIPTRGTFWLIQGPSAPHPSPPSELGPLDIYDLGAGHYMVDDRAVDYAALDEQRAIGRALTELEAAYGLVEADGVGPLDLLYTDQDLWLEIVGWTNTTAHFILHPPAAEASAGVFDLFQTMNLSPEASGLNLTNWAFRARTAPGQTNISVAELTAAEGYFRAARTNDSDGDLLSDAYEALVSHSNAGETDTDGDGVSDYIEVLQGRNPNRVATASDAENVIKLQVFSPQF